MDLGMELEGSNTSSRGKILAGAKRKKKAGAGVINEPRLVNAVVTPAKWIEFVKAHQQIAGGKYGDSLKSAAPLFKKYKEQHGAGIIDSLNDFLMKHIAGPIGKAVLKRLTGNGKK